MALVARVVAVLLALLACPRVARACSCAFGPYLVAPASGATDVPINAKVWIGGDYAYEGTDPVLLDPDGSAVPLTLSTIETVGGGVTIYDPGELLPETVYDFYYCTDMICPQRVTQFVTGTERDDTPPALPVETSREPGHAGPLCGTSKWVEFEVDYEGLLLVDIDENATEQGAHNGTVTHASMDPIVTVGRGGCSTGFPEGSSATVRFASFDVAGNFSGWTDPDGVTLVGCTCTAGDAGPPAWWALLVLFAWRRSSLTSWRRDRGSTGRRRCGHW